MKSKEMRCDPSSLMAGVNAIYTQGKSSQLYETEGTCKRREWELGGGGVLCGTRRREWGWENELFTGGSHLGKVITEDNITHNMVMVRVITRDNISWNIIVLRFDNDWSLCYVIGKVVCRMQMLRDKCFNSLWFCLWLFLTVEPLLVWNF